MMSWQRFAELVAKNQESGQSVLDILFVISQLQGCLGLSLKTIEKVFTLILLPSPSNFAPESVPTVTAFGALSGGLGRWSATHAHLRISIAYQHSHSIGQILGKLNIAIAAVRQRSSPRFFSYTYLLHTVFTAHKLFLSLSLSPRI